MVECERCLATSSSQCSLGCFSNASSTALTSLIDLQSWTRSAAAIPRGVGAGPALQPGGGVGSGGWAVAGDSDADRAVAAATPAVAA